MEYNSTRPFLTMKEYGRNVQKMADHLLEIQDKEERTRAAMAIINTMGQLNPSAKELVDYKQKLWDHLQIITNYSLDVDCPFTLPEKPKEAIKPERLEYSYREEIRYSYFGRIIQKMIEKAIAYPEGDEKEALVLMIANQMKRLYLLWNKDSVTDDAIREILLDISKGQLKIPENVRLSRSFDLVQKTGNEKASYQSSGKSKKKKSISRPNPSTKPYRSNNSGPSNNFKNRHNG